WIPSISPSSPRDYRPPLPPSSGHPQFVFLLFHSSSLAQRRIPPHLCLLRPGFYMLLCLSLLLYLLHPCFSPSLTPPHLRLLSRCISGQNGRKHFVEVAGPKKSECFFLIIQLYGSRPNSDDLSRTNVVLYETVLPETVLAETMMPETMMLENVLLDAYFLESDLPTLDVCSAIDLYVPDVESDVDSEANREVESDTSNEGVHEDYFDRLNDNGEVYDEHCFGKIKLKSWMIFQEKDHLMEVLRDLCVQDGFTVVVQKTDHRRYTSLCGDSNCKWRINASRLSDEVTWAIKTLIEKHTCLKVGKFNFITTPEWATKKIVGLVRGDT
ncbi:hypothetical protein V2J09_013187, partial [Rumex salicifolius]